jgi:hypothetical protein
MKIDPPLCPSIQGELLHLHWRGKAEREIADPIDGPLFARAYRELERHPSFGRGWGR